MDYVSGLSKTMTIRGYPIKVVSPKQAEAERKQPEPERFELDGDPTRGRSGSRGAPLSAAPAGLPYLFLDLGGSGGTSDFELPRTRRLRRGELSKAAFSSA